ncbi:MAG TPA: SDR family NAD(P)-dependent oxidoreductase [Planctomycetaceae bacterium]|nr:SDR family NAD(P)-dependent oxidoreductase [Planctomycetaceae bacterium]
MPETQPVAIITGGGTGVGQATALRLGKKGWAVVVNYSRSAEDAEETVAEVKQSGGKAIAIRASVAEDAECVAMVEQTMAAFGRIDVLVNCAGTTEFIAFQNLDDVTDDVWQRLYQVNVVGAFHCARAVRKPMLASGGGQIINVSSVAAILAQGSSIPYCCTKSALDNLTVSLARTLAPEIRVNAVAPGFIAGRWTQNGLGERYDSIKTAYENTLPLKTVCTPDDIAAGIVSLVEGSRVMTGQTLTIDAGMTIAGYQVKYD